LTAGLNQSWTSSGCWPSWAFQAHSVIFMSEKTAVKEDSSGEQVQVNGAVGGQCFRDGVDEGGVGNFFLRISEKNRIFTR